MVTGMPDSDTLPQTYLDAGFTFGTFVVGHSNEFACAAARRVAEADKPPFNPLYLFGGPGAGATHLMHAIGWHMMAAAPKRRVIATSVQPFLAAFGRARLANEEQAWHAQWLSVNGLMIDDIQCFGGTVQYFAETLMGLVANGCQIVVTADKPPADLDQAGDALRRLFGGGLTVAVPPPTYELRHHILKEKSRGMRAAVPEEVLALLARENETDIRVLLGGLNGVLMRAQLTGRAVTVELAEEVIRASR